MFSAAHAPSPPLPCSVPLRTTPPEPPAGASQGVWPTSSPQETGSALWAQLLPWSRLPGLARWVSAELRGLLGKGQLPCAVCRAWEAVASSHHRGGNRRPREAEAARPRSCRGPLLWWSQSWKPGLPQHPRSLVCVPLSGLRCPGAVTSCIPSMACSRAEQGQCSGCTLQDVV